MNRLVMWGHITAGEEDVALQQGQLILSLLPACAGPPLTSRDLDEARLCFRFETTLSISAGDTE